MASILRGAHLASFDPPTVERRDLGIEGDRIVAPENLPTGTPVLDCSGKTVIPGLVVAHSHLYSALARGMPAPPGPTPSFRAILEQVWWRLDRALDPRSLGCSAEVGALEALRAGTTTLIDHHESPSFIDGSLSLIAERTRRVGLKAALCYGATDRHGAGDAARGLAESARFEREARGGAWARGMIGVHAPFTASEATLERAASDAKATGALLHLHVAEGPDDRADALSRGDRSAFARLDRHGALGPRTLVAHAVDADAEDAALLRARGAIVAHQARSNMNNAVGYARELAGLEGVVLGTDGIDDDLRAELKAAFFRRREHAGSTAWPDPLAWLANNHRLAGAIFGEPELGRLVAGAPADLVVLDYDPPTPLEAATLGAHLLFGGMSSAPARHVFVRGEHVIADGRATRIDEAELKARAREEARRLWARLDSRAPGV